MQNFRESGPEHTVKNINTLSTQSRDKSQHNEIILWYYLFHRNVEGQEPLLEMLHMPKITGAHLKSTDIQYIAGAIYTIIWNGLKGKKSGHQLLTFGAPQSSKQPRVGLCL